MDRIVRRLIAFACADDMLIGSLDEAAETTGLLIVSGGNEVRSGAHRGMAVLAAEVADAGFPVFRYDRRGIGDSTGENCGYLSSAPDLAAAIATFRAQAPHVEHIVGFGNCDAASALALFGYGIGIDRVLLANPWTIADDDGLPPVAAIRARYAARLRNPVSIIRRGIDVRKAWRGLRKVVGSRSDDRLAPAVIAGIERWGEDADIILAGGDTTAIAFRAAAAHLPVQRVDTDSHSFARPRDKTTLRDAVLRCLATRN